MAAQLLHGLRVGNGAEAGIADARCQQRRQQGRGVAVSTGARIVCVIRHDDGPLVPRCVLFADSRRILGRVVVVLRHHSTGPDVVGKGRGEAGMGCHVALRRHQHGGPDLGDVGTGKTAVDTDRKHVWQLLVSAGPGNALHHRPHVSAPAIHLLQHGPRQTQGQRANFALHGPLQDAGRVLRCDPHVGVRIGLVGDDDVGQVTHGAADIGVRIQGDGNRQIRADLRAQAAQDLAFAVITEVGHHGAV